MGGVFVSSNVLVYEYGGRGEPSNADLIDEQILLAHRYRNKLVEIELKRRTAVRELFSAHPDADLQLLQGQIETAEAALAEVRVNIANHRKTARTKKGPAELLARRRELGATLKQLRADLRERKRAVREDEALQAALRQTQEVAWQAIRDARAINGLYWGTYLAVEQGADRARKGRMDPRFKRFDGTGKIAVQLQGGLLVADALSGQDSRLRIDPVPNDVWEHRTPGRDPGARTFARIRISSDGRNPIWATVPIVYHRPLPKDAVIKWAYLLKQRVGRKYRWRVQLVMETPESETATSYDVVALDVGWRMIDGDLRVAYWVGSDGEQGEVRIPKAWLVRMKKVEDLRSIRDQHFNVIRPALGNWLATNKPPEWLAEVAKTLPQWRSPGRLAALALRWRDNRFDGDEAIYGRLESWRKKDAHLYDWEANLRDKLLRRRREIYRVFAVQLRERYGAVVLEDFDLRQAARRDGNIGEEAPDRARALRYLAALSELRTILEHSMEVVKSPAMHTTVTCHACGSIEKFDAAANLRHTCLACGTTWDQDYNAAKNLLTWAEASSSAVAT